MIPVDQAITDMSASGGRKGDCVRACLASLLELPLRYVPHVIEHPDWWIASRLAVRDLTDDRLDLVCHTSGPVYVPGGWERTAHLIPGSPEAPIVIASGPSPRGDWLHAVLLNDATGALVHDPHPSRDGLAGPPVDFIALTTAAEAESFYGLPRYGDAA